MLHVCKRFQFHVKLGHLEKGLFSNMSSCGLEHVFMWAQAVGMIDILT